jgi:hypothetical protein
VVRAKWEVQAALRRARRLGSSHPADVRVCWDLDNTLVDSGALLRLGKSLEDAIREAGPVPHMLEFYDAVSELLPNAAHFILSSRTGSLRTPTLLWLARHGLTPGKDTLCFVPYVDAKPKVWAQLARGASLVIVDDLSYDHESSQPSVHLDLVEVARRTATVYVGPEQIADVAADPAAVRSVATWVAESLAA